MPLDKTSLITVTMEKPNIVDGNVSDSSSAQSTRLKDLCQLSRGSRPHGLGDIEDRSDSQVTEGGSPETLQLDTAMLKSHEDGPSPVASLTSNKKRKYLYNPWIPRKGPSPVTALPSNKVGRGPFSWMCGVCGYDHHTYIKNCQNCGWPRDIPKLFLRRPIDDDDVSKESAKRLRG